MTHVNLTCEAFEAQLPEYLEGTLSDSSAADAELHLASCAACRQLVTDLREITRQAAALPGVTPSRDLWPAIEARTQAPVIDLATVRRAAPSPWRLGAIAAALVGITAISTYTITRQNGVEVAGRAPAPVAGESTVATTAPSVESRTPDPEPRAPTPVALRAPRPEAGITYSNEIQRLHDVIDNRSEELDPRTVAVLRSSIATIDSAITEARAALARDPASRFLTQQLNKSLERKLGLLRQAALLSPST